MTETEKMLAGKIYDASDSHLADRRIVAHRLSKQYNDTFEDEAEKRTAILKELIPNLGEDTYLQGPIQFDYGLLYHIRYTLLCQFQLCCAGYLPDYDWKQCLFWPQLHFGNAIASILTGGTQPSGKRGRHTLHLGIWCTDSHRG